LAGPVEAIESASVEVAALGLTMREMIEQADRNAVRVIREMREAVRVADEEDDPGSADLLTRTVQIHEKHEWFLRDVLEKRADGFLS
jgi:starvation-inducible DNA-binding protein